jgi:phage repressor protein C with HTH and peptisase S24 domain
MSWASYHIEKLKAGTEVSFRPHGNSMLPHIKNGQLITITPNLEVGVGDIVLVKVKRNVYVHFIKSKRDGQLLIANASGHENGWTSSDKVYGKVTHIETEKDG